MKEIETIKINEIEYVRKDSIGGTVKNLDGLIYAIVRTYSAGVFAGWLQEQTGQEVILLNARRLWQWSGAASLSQLAVDGTSKPEDCKFPCEVSELKLLQAIEILHCTEKSKKSINEVAVWKV